MMIWTSLMKSLGNSGLHGPVGEPARQHFLVAGPDFALDETAGNLARGIRFLTVIDRQGKEILAFL